MKVKEAEMSYNANIYINGKSVFIDERLIKVDGDLTSDELCMVATLSEMLRALDIKKPLSYEPNLERIKNKSIAKCEWIKTNKIIKGEKKSNIDRLRIIEYETNKKYRHAETVKEAINRYRIFTCPTEVAVYLNNRHRNSKIK